MPLPSRMLSRKRDELRNYAEVARGVRQIGVIEEPQEHEEESVWRGSWRNGPVVLAETPDAYKTPIEALRAAATYFVQATNKG